MLRIMRVIEWDMGHRLVGHEGKCRHLHGHRYSAEFVVTAPSTDEVGRVIDFGVIKQEMKTFIDDKLDHKTMLNESDKLVALLNNEKRKEMRVSVGVSESELYVVPFNPTAEHIAQHLLEVAQKRLTPYGVHPVSVKVWETPNCWAEVVA
jgi:6-pyruvoyltetrahydropterin/6-carboxytetrahydropterin synthase